MINLKVFNKDSKLLHYNEKWDMVYKHHLELSKPCFEQIINRRKIYLEEGRVADYQAYIKEQFHKSLGDFIITRTPLNSRTVGYIEGNDYRIEKVIFESMPQFYVTANLYIPNNITGKAPAVLVNLGHWDDGKSEPNHQILAGNLACMGFVVLVYEPIGQGERIHYFDSKKGRGNIKLSVEEHELFGIKALLYDVNVATVFIRDAVRAVDYLESRDEVDPERIGCIGSSGGGMLTLYLMVVEERIKAAVPVCYTTTIKRILDESLAGDAEQHPGGALTKGLEHAEFCISMAPKPLMINASVPDSFPIEGAKETYQVAREFYKALGYEDNISINEAQSIHGLNIDHRMPAYDFFLKHLKCSDEKIDFEREVTIHNPEDLCVTDIGQVKEIDNSMKLDDILVNLEKQRTNICTPELLKQLLKMPQTTRPTVTEIDRKVELPGMVHVKLQLETEKGIFVPVNVLYDEKNIQKVTFVLFDEGKPLILGKEYNQRIKNGEAVVFCDYRGIGESKFEVVLIWGYDRSDWFERYHLHNYMMFDRNLVGCWVFDLMQTVEAVREMDVFENIPIKLEAEGSSAIVAAFTGVLNDSVDELELHNMLANYSLLIRCENYLWDAGIILPGILKHADLPEVLSLFAPRKLRIINPLDAGKGKLKIEDAKAVFKPVSSICNLEIT